MLKIGNSYKIYPDRNIPELSNDLAVAVAARSEIKGMEKQCYALLCDPRYPPRLADIDIFRTLSVTELQLPVYWSVVTTKYYPRQSPVLVFERQAKLKPLVTDLKKSFTPFDHNFVIDNLIVPSLRTISKLESEDITHRAIMPTNVFGDRNSNQPIMLGQCFSSPVGSMQHEVFELVNYAMADRFGRGTASWQNDIFALGVTALSLVLGRVPALDIDPHDLIHARLENSVLQLYLGDTKLPERLMVLLRGMISDYPKGIKTVSELQNWLFKRNPTSHYSGIERSHTALRYKSREHRNLASFAQTIFLNWPEARSILSSERVINWITRVVSQLGLPFQIIEVIKRIQDIEAHSEISERAVGQNLIIMNPAAPIRLPDYSIRPEAMIIHAAVNIDSQEVMRRLRQTLTTELLGYWVDLQSGEGQEARLSTVFFFQSALNRMRPDAEIGLLLYEFYHDLPCQSSIISNNYVITLEQLVLALEDTAAELTYDPDNFLIDEHITAFAFSRTASERISLNRKDLENQELHIKQIAGMEVLSNIQQHYRIKKLENLFEYGRALLTHLATGINLKAPRERLLKQIRSIKNNGNLSSLLLLWRKGYVLESDKQEFARALNNYRNNVAREMVIARRLDEYNYNYFERGRDASILVGSSVGLGGLIVLLIMAI